MFFFIFCVHAAFVWIKIHVKYASPKSLPPALCPLTSIRPTPRPLRTSQRTFFWRWSPVNLLSTLRQCPRSHRFVHQLYTQYLALAADADVVRVVRVASSAVDDSRRQLDEETSPTWLTWQLALVFSCNEHPTLRCVLARGGHNAFHFRFNYSWQNIAYDTEDRTTDLHPQVK